MCKQLCEVEKRDLTIPMDSLYYLQLSVHCAAIRLALLVVSYYLRAYFHFSGRFPGRSELAGLP